MKVKIINLPAHYASALVNNDYSGLDTFELAEVNKLITGAGPFSFVGVSEDTFIGRHDGMLCDMAEYQLLN